MVSSLQSFIEKDHQWFSHLETSDQIHGEEVSVIERLESGEKLTYSFGLLRSLSLFYKEHPLLISLSFTTLSYNESLKRRAYKEYLKHIKFILAIFHLPLIVSILEDTPVSPHALHTEVMEPYIYDFFLSLHILLPLEPYYELYLAFNRHDPHDYQKLLRLEDQRLQVNPGYYHDKYFAKSFVSFEFLEQSLNDFLGVDRKTTLVSQDLLDDPTKEFDFDYIETLSASTLRKIRHKRSEEESFSFSSSSCRYFETSEDFNFFDYFDNIFYLIFSSYLLSTDSVLLVLPLLDPNLIWVNQNSTIFDKFFLYNKSLGKILPLIKPLLSYNFLNFSAFGRPYFNPIYKLVSNCDSFLAHHTISAGRDFERSFRDDPFLFLLNYMDKSLLYFSFISFYDRKLSQKIDMKYFSLSNSSRFQHFIRKCDIHSEFSPIVTPARVLFNDRFHFPFIPETDFSSFQVKSFKSFKSVPNPENPPAYFNNYNIFFSTKSVVQILLHNNHLTPLHLAFLLTHLQKKFFFYKEYNVSFLHHENPGMSIRERLDCEDGFYFLQYLYHEFVSHYFYVYYFENIYKLGLKKFHVLNGGSGSLSSSSSPDGFHRRNLTHITLFDFLIINPNLLSFELLIFFSYFLVSGYLLLHQEGKSQEAHFFSSPDVQLNALHLSLILRNRRLNLNMLVFLFFAISRRDSTITEFVLDTTQNHEAFLNLSLENLERDSPFPTNQKKSWWSSLGRSKDIFSQNIFKFLQEKDLEGKSALFFLLSNPKLGHKILLFVLILLKRINKFKETFHFPPPPDSKEKQKRELHPWVEDLAEESWLYPSTDASQNQVPTASRALFSNFSFFCRLYDLNKPLDLPALNHRFNPIFIQLLHCESLVDKKFFFVNNMGDSYDEFLLKFLSKKEKFFPFYEESDSEYSGSEDEGEEITLQAVQEELQEISHANHESNFTENSNLLSRKDKRLCKLLRLCYQKKKKLHSHQSLVFSHREIKMEEPSSSYCNFYRDLLTSSLSCSDKKPLKFSTQRSISYQSFLSFSRLYSAEFVKYLGSSPELLSKSSPSRDSSGFDFEEYLSTQMASRVRKSEVHTVLDRFLDSFFKNFDEVIFFNKFKENLQKTFFDEISLETESLSGDSILNDLGSDTSSLTQADQALPFPEILRQFRLPSDPTGEPHKFSEKFSKVFSCSTKIDSEADKKLGTYLENLETIILEIFSENPTQSSSVDMESLESLYRHTIINEKIFLRLLPYLTDQKYMSCLPLLLKDAPTKSQLLFTSEEFFTVLKSFASLSPKPTKSKSLPFEKLNFIKKYTLVYNLLRVNGKISWGSLYNILYLTRKSCGLQDFIKLFFLINHDKCRLNIFLVLLKNLTYNITASLSHASSASDSHRVRLAYYNEILLIFYYYSIFLKFFHEHREELGCFLVSSGRDTFFIWKEILLLNNLHSLLKERGIKAFVNIVSGLLESFL